MQLKLITHNSIKVLLLCLICFKSYMTLLPQKQREKKGIQCNYFKILHCLLYLKANYYKYIGTHSFFDHTCSASLMRATEQKHCIYVAIKIVTNGSQLLLQFHNFQDLQSKHFMTYSSNIPHNDLYIWMRKMCILTQFNIVAITFYDFQGKFNFSMTFKA